MPEDLLTDPDSFRASGREEMPNIISLLGLPVLAFAALRFLQAPPILLIFIFFGAFCCVFLASLSVRRLFIRYRITDSHLEIPGWFKSLAVPLEGLKLSHEPKKAWFPGRMTVYSESLPAPGLFYLPDSWVDGEPERERFLQALEARGVELDLPGFRRSDPPQEDRQIGACTRSPDGWEKAGAWTFAWGVGLGVYFVLGRAQLLQMFLPILMALGGLILVLLTRRRRLSEAGDICFKGLEVWQESQGKTLWRRSLSNCEAVHCTYSWPAQLPRRKLILRSNDDEHLALTAWQTEEDESWLKLCEALRTRGCRILIEEADDRDVPHTDD